MILKGVFTLHPESERVYLQGPSMVSIKAQQKSLTQKFSAFKPKPGFLSAADIWLGALPHSTVQKAEIILLGFF